MHNYMNCQNKMPTANEAQPPLCGCGSFPIVCRCGVACRLDSRLVGQQLGRPLMHSRCGGSGIEVLARHDEQLCSSPQSGGMCVPSDGFEAFCCWMGVVSDN